MPQFRTLDYGAAIRSAEGIRFDRLRNQAMGAELKEQENLINRRKQYEEIRAKYENAPDEIEALEKAGLAQEADQLRESYTKQVIGAVELAGAMREAIGPDNYQQARSDFMNKLGVPAWVFPEKYSEKWMRQKEKEEQNRLDAITFTLGPGEDGRPLLQDWVVDSRGKAVRKGKAYQEPATGRAGVPKRSVITRREERDGARMAQDQEVVDGEVVWSGEWYPDPKAGGKGGGDKFAASDSNAIKNAARGLYATMFDPDSGKFIGIKGEDERKALEVAALAEAIFEKEGVPHNVAVAMAARQKGIPIGKAFRDYEQGLAVQPFPSSGDPHNIRDLIEKLDKIDEAD